MSYLERVSKILRTKCIKEENLQHYCTKYPEWNNTYSIRPMFDNIEPFLYYQPLEKLNYDSKIIDIAKKLSGSTISLTDKKTDQIILEYIKCRPRCLLIMMRYKKINPDLLKYLSGVGYVYYIKHIKLTFRAYRSLIYQIYADTKQYNKIDEIDVLLKDTFKFDKNGGYISVIVFDNINNKPLAILHSKINKYVITSNAFYITPLFYRTIEHAQIYFCTNSLKFLEEQSLERHIMPNMRKSRVLLSTFRNWISNNIDLKSRRSFLIMSGCILYIYGIRNIHDIDVYIDDTSYNEEIDKYLLNDETKFYFVDSIMPNSNKWKPYWNNWSIKWANIIGAETFKEVVYNPKYHFYYLGLKFMVIQGDIERRLIRQRPRSIVDLIKINEILGYKIKIPSIPDSQKKYIRLKEGEEVGELDENKRYNESNREIECIEKIDKEQFLSTIQWYFKTMYYQEYTIDEIKKLVGYKMVKMKIVKKRDASVEVKKTVKIRIKKN